jgi:hypothetical protein
MFRKNISNNYTEIQYRGCRFWKFEFDLKTVEIRKLKSTTSGPHD